jgi:hypothetical protein
MDINECCRTGNLSEFRRLFTAQIDIAFSHTNIEGADSLITFNVIKELIVQTMIDYCELSIQNNGSIIFDDFTHEKIKELFDNYTQIPIKQPESD